MQSKPSTSSAANKQAADHYRDNCQNPTIHSHSSQVNSHLPLKEREAVNFPLNVLPQQVCDQKMPTALLQPPALAPHLTDFPTSVPGLPFEGAAFSQKQTAINLIAPQKCQINPFTASKKSILLMLQPPKNPDTEPSGFTVGTQNRRG